MLEYENIKLSPSSNSCLQWIFYQFQLSYEHISKTEYWGDLDIYIGPVLSIMV